MKLALKNIFLLLAGTLMFGAVIAQQPGIVSLQFKWKHQLHLAGNYATVGNNLFEKAGIKANWMEAIDEVINRDVISESNYGSGIYTSKLLLMPAQQRTAFILSTFIQHSPQVVFLLLLTIILITGSGSVFFYYTSRKLRIEIKNRTLLEKGLLESEEHYKALFNNNSASVAVIEEDSRISMVNDAFCQMTGFTNEEITGTSWIQQIPPGDRERLMEYNHRRVINPDDAPGKYDFTYYHKNGEIKHSIMSVTVNEKSRKTIASFIDISERIHLENSLRESEEKFREMADLLPQIVFETDLQGMLTYVNKQAFRILRYPENYEVLGINTLNLYIPEDIPRAIENHKLKLSGKLEESNEYTMLRYDGSLINVLIYSNPIIRENKTVGLRGLIVDITNIKNAEEELREGEYKYRILTESMKDVVWTLDPKTMNFNYVSPSVEKLRGYTPEEVIAVPFDAALTPEGAEYVRNQLNIEIDKFLVSPVHQPHYTLHELEQPCKDGSSVWTEVVTNFYLNKKNNQIEVLGVTRDITDRKRAEDALRKSEEMLRDAGRLAKMGGWELDLKTMKLTWSEETYRIHEVNIEDTHLAVDHAIGFYAPDAQQVISAAVERARSEGTPYDLELPIIAANGQHKWVRTVGNAERVNNQTIRLYGIFQDITERKQAEDELREKELQYRNLADSGRALIWKAGTDKLCNYFNKIWLEFTGRIFEQEMGNGWAEGVHPDDLDKCLEIYTTSFDKHEPFEMEYRLHHSSGEFRWLHDIGTPNFDSTGKFIGYIGHCFDISDRKQSELELLSAKFELEQFFNLVPDLVTIASPDGFLKKLNTEWEKTLGYTIQELQNIPFEHLIHPDDIINTRQEVERQKQGNNTIRFENRYRHKDGTYRWLSWNAAPVHDNHLYAAAHDITERREAEELLRETNAYLENLINYANAPIIVWDTQFRITRFNHAFESLTGRLEADVIGQTIDILFPAELAENSMELIRKTLSGERWETVEIEILHLDNSIKTVIWNSATLFAPDGNTPVATIAQGQEITRRINAEKELKLKNDELLLLNTEKNKYFSIIAHDLRSPLSGFMGLTQIMAERLPQLTMEELQKIAARMRTSATNLFRLLENLLHWAHIEQGLIPFDPKIFHLSPIINESIAMAIEPARKKGIELVCSVSDEITVVADTNMLQTIIRNMVSNAIKFTPKRGNISLSAEITSSKNVKISVKDSGIGMSSEMIANLFRLHVQTSRTGTESEPSTGLGLIICKEFIEKHGGKLIIESEVGTGSSFSFILPGRTHPEENNGATDSIPGNNTTNQVKSLKVLIAEDDETSGMLLSLALKPFSTGIVKVNNGASAVESCIKNPDFDLIMMDIKMPDMDGYEATRQIRKFNKQVVIIAQTAFGLKGERQKALDAGCNDYITKPMSVTILLELIRKHYAI